MRFSPVLSPLALAAVAGACGDDGPNTPPTAAFAIQCDRLTCTTANGSTDADGTIAAYTWDFGDETGPVSTREPSHTYAATGRFTVTLSVRDDDGDSSSADKAVTIVNGNRAPTAIFTIDCAELTCTFVDRSLDPDGTVVSHRWDFGDGSEPWTGRDAVHTYADSGDFTARLTVQDEDGASGTAALPVIFRLAPNLVPFAHFTYSCTDLTCDFKDHSHDPDGSVTEYSWNFQDVVTSTEKDPRYTFGSPGFYPVELTVTDDRGATSNFRTAILIPAPEFEVACVKTVCQFMPQLEPWVTGVLWRFGDGTTSGETNPTHTYEVTEPQTFTVTLIVTDEWEGYANSREVTVTP